MFRHLRGAVTGAVLLASAGAVTLTVTGAILSALAEAVLLTSVKAKPLLSALDALNPFSKERAKIG
jgi:hypothetical protein